MTPLSGNRLDLRGTPCPLNFVLIKLELDRLGELVPLCVISDGGHTGRDILCSLRAQGFRVTDITASQSSIKFTVAAPANMDS